MEWQKMFDNAPLATVILVLVAWCLRWIAPRLDRLIDCLIAFIARTGDLVEAHSDKLDAIHGDVRTVKDGVATLLRQPKESPHD